jgi:hypothetical protein
MAHQKEYTLEHLSLFIDSFVKHHLSNWSLLMLKQCKDRNLNSARVAVFVEKSPCLAN